MPDTVETSAAVPGQRTLCVRDFLEADSSDIASNGKVGLFGIDREVAFVPCSTPCFATR